MPRRDRCHLIGHLGHRLTPAQAEAAWFELCAALERLGEKDIPKFNDLLESVRNATIHAKRVGSSAGFSRRVGISQVSNLHPNPITQ
jgi:hypothetical protein